MNYLDNKHTTRQAYPQDAVARAAVGESYQFGCGEGDDAYLAGVSGALARAFAAFPSPDLVVFNAGTDVLAGDPLGHCEVSPAGVVARDEAVWAAARAAGSPICMVLSGGYRCVQQQGPGAARDRGGKAT